MQNCFFQSHYHKTATNEVYKTMPTILIEKVLKLLKELCRGIWQMHLPNGKYIRPWIEQLSPGWGTALCTWATLLLKWLSSSRCIKVYWKIILLEVGSGGEGGGGNPATD